MKFVSLVTAVLPLLILGEPDENLPLAYNDLIENAEVVDIGFMHGIDTTETTIDEYDLKLNDYFDYDCFIAPAASVWYKYTPSVDTYVGIDTGWSSYSVGLLIGEGSPNSLTNLRCFYKTASFNATANTTYYIMAVDDNRPINDETENDDNIGGSLGISFIEINDSPVLLSFAVNPTGTVNARTGKPSFSGTYSCTCPDFGRCSHSVVIEATQDLGHLTGYTTFGLGFAYKEYTCNGTEQSWTSITDYNNNRFKARSVNITAFSAVFDQYYGFDESELQHLTVDLKRRPRI